MSLRSTFKTDPKAEVEGVWQDVDINDHNGLPIRIHISRMSKSNKRYTKRFEAATRPHQAAINNESLPEGLANKLLRNVFVDTILLGWENLPKSELTGNSEDTELLDFSKENALALFEELPDCYDSWEEIAKKAASFREAVIEDSAKN